MHGEDDSDGGEPEEFSDPITLSLMEEAMMAPCGHSFSRDSITTWLRQNHPSCPVCKGALTEDKLVPNYSLRSAIERYQGKHPPKPDAVPMQDASKFNRDSYMPPDPVKPPPYVPGVGSSYGPGPGIDADADAPPAAPSAPPAAAVAVGGGGGDVEEGGCLHDLTKEAREADQGCCMCKCEGPVYCCETAHQCEQKKCCANPSCPWYISPSAVVCMACFGTNSTYTNRTVAGLCFPPFALVICVLAMLEVAFLCAFWVVGFFVISPIWIFLRLPINLFCPLYYTETIKPSCWDKTFGCQ